MLEGQLYAVECFTGRGDDTETGFFVARNDMELVSEFGNRIKTFQFMGAATIFGFFDSEIEEGDDDPSD